MKPELQYISLFTGAGGLDLGLEASGWKPTICVEIDDDARAVASRNKPDWLFSIPGDINRIARNPRLLADQADIKKSDIQLIAGGPPCQPFSKAGLWHKGTVGGLSDPRANTVRSLMATVRHFLPRFVLIENVPGFADRTSAEGFKYLRNSFARINGRYGTRYRLSCIPLNAADYGAPQIRKRIFLLADRTGRTVEAPQETHGPSGAADHLCAWDAIGDLALDAEERASLCLSGKWAELLPSIPEGRNYLWHTEKGGGLPLFGYRTRYWTFLLKLAKSLPSWTIHAQPGPSTGPFHWTNRQLSVHELARLQTFPDSFEFPLPYRKARSVIGNAVPPVMGEAIGRQLVRMMGHKLPDPAIWIEPDGQSRRPRRAPTRPVPERYEKMAGNHRAHPGTGLGPGARPTSIA